MWTWFGIALLVRVLLASNEAHLHDQITNSLSDGSRISSDELGERVLQGELLTEATIKPKLSNVDLKWNNDNVYHNLRPYERTISNLIRELSGSSNSKNFPKDLDDQRDKRSPIKNTDTTLTTPWMSWMTLENRALPFRNGQDPWQEIKKSRAFSPWGGKRVTVYGQEVKVRRPIRIPFNSWGGKRSFSDEQKRTRFSSWGGKRGWYLNTKENSLENGIEKRTKFNAWGGKRSKNGDVEDEEIKRTRFNAWGGKRGGTNYKRTPEEIVAKKNVFNAWGGKRFYNIDKISEGQGELEKMVDNEKYLEGGGGEEEDEEGDENDIDDDNEDDDLNMENEIPSESEITIELPAAEKKGGVDKIHKSSFNPWGGKKKKSEYDGEELIGQGLNLIIPESNGIQGHHHERFWSWGG